VTNLNGFAKLIQLPEILLLYDIVPHTQKYLNRSFDRAYHITISDDLIAESLPRALLQAPYDSSGERLDVPVMPTGLNSK
jgi:hypothetical protein